MFRIVRNVLPDGKIEGILAEDINTKIIYSITKGGMGKYYD